LTAADANLTHACSDAGPICRRVSNRLLAEALTGHNELQRQDVRSLQESSYVVVVEQSVSRDDDLSIAARHIARSLGPSER
jgi:hypothetical protein